MSARCIRAGWLLVPCLCGAACGAKTDLDRPDAVEPDVPQPGPELCNGLNDDFDQDNLVDEDFRDDLGRYIDVHNCGVCGHDCDGAVDHATASSCILVGGVPTCGASACEAGWVPSETGRCVPWDAHLCLPCIDDGDCGSFADARCADVGGESRCTVTCDAAAPSCPAGYDCLDGLCAPPGRSCSCDPGEFFTVSCNITTPDGGDCLGTATCSDGVLSDCVGSAEICDGRDDNCDGQIDEGFRDTRGQYSLDPHNCGACGVDCAATVLPDGQLVCGGDPYGPRCRLLCADTLDGLQVGDHLDADLIIGDGCECTVSALDDAAGPVHAFGQDLDVNCDGADGDVPYSLYVAPDGDDANPGSPMYPLRTVGEGVRRAAASLTTDTPTPDVFVAAGTYAEVVRVADGVRLHGGYRNDFLGLEPDAFITAVVAPDASDAPGGAALVLEAGAGTAETVVEGFHFRGTDAPAAGMPAFGAFLHGVGPRLALRNLEIRAGQGGAGAHGTFGAAGAAPTVAAVAGDPPRGAVEDSTHACRPDATNVVGGGAGGVNTCPGDVGGGAGASSSCPTFDMTQPGGMTGHPGSGGAYGGMGGPGGWDCEGPVTGFPCPTAVCCGLADFTVPLEYEMAGDGSNGGAGGPGTAGTGCANPLGVLAGETWSAATATTGTTGLPGGGGGGGGAGGGAVMDWYDVVCPWPDGLGGGGGGGGAGGCGGQGGAPGTSGAPSIGIVMDMASSTAVPSFDNVRILSGDGGLGGRGGGGGDGGLGGLGAAGGEVPRSDRTTPTLAGPSPGGHGGKGGSGGPGGGGGGGCGGPSVGVWALLHGAPDPGIAAAVASGATVTRGHGGHGGRGGPGAAPGGDGTDGVEQDVVVQ